MNGPSLRIVTASAGTGKTHRLGTAMLEAVQCGTAPDRILATTFTNRAASELLERARARLITERLPEAALGLMLARIGTVNGVFGRILGTLALDQGRSPVVAVIPEDAQARLFRIAADPVIAQHAPVLSELAERFGFTERHATEQLDWRRMLTDLVAVARLNGLERDGLAASAKRSWQELRSLLPDPKDSAQALDSALVDAVAQTHAALGTGDGTQTTNEAIEKLNEARRILARPTPPPWSLWAALSKLNASKTSNIILDPVRRAASRHPEHPRLHADLERFISTIFTAAADALAEVQRFKRRRGLVDFVDQEAEALALLADPAIAARVASELDLLLVDEFQDTSPIQLALFMRLARLVPRTLFVGDPKQSIYGFRGTDPELVAAVTDWITRQSGQQPETLATNRRSRPGLVALTNAVFSRVFPKLGIPANQVQVTAAREDAPGQDAPLHVWRVEGSNADIAARTLAARVAKLLSDPARWRIVPRSGPDDACPLAGGDIAILTLTNRNAERLAAALSAAGLKVALERPGLLDRAECAVALAGLRVLADPTDTLAIAEILHILAGDDERPAWLEDALAAPHPRDALTHRDPIPTLLAAREGLTCLTPAEVLDRAIDVLDLTAWLPRWGDAAARHANLQALRTLACDYEEECRRERLPASAAGLAAWLMSRKTVSQPASPDPDAVHVMTVHRAKGLEWPVVILADLDTKAQPRLFNAPVAMASQPEFDPEAPLAGRWVRLWPWPYGTHKQGVHLDATAAQSAIGKTACQAEEREKARLLYVALTRARDYLVFAPGVKVAKNGQRTLSTGWLDLFNDALRLPTADGPILAGDQAFPAVSEDVGTVEVAGGPKEGPKEGTMSALPEGPAPCFASRRYRPSTATDSTTPFFTVCRIGDRVPLTGHPDMQRVGEAVHRFMAADRRSASPGWRESLARRLLDTWQVSALSPQNLIAAADRFWEYLASEHPGARLRREWPLIQVEGGSIVSGRADLVVELDNGFAIYDHKTFPGGEDLWPEEMAAYAPQLASYAAVLTKATGKPVLRRAVHLPISGAVLFVSVE